MQVMVPRTISRTYATVVEELELDGSPIVTLERLASILGGATSDEGVRRCAYELTRRGWLGSLRTRGAWEFYPASRAGAYPSGDPYIEFRAQHAVNPSWAGTLAMESAASLLGLSQHVSEQAVVALGLGDAFPKALVGDWRYIRLPLPAAAIIDVDGLPTWGREGLLVGIAARPSGYHDVAGLAQWLTSMSVPLDPDLVVSLVKEFPQSVKQRTAYLLSVAGMDDSSQQVNAAYPPRGIAWLGQREDAGTFDAATKVFDTTLAKYLTAGTGA